MTDKGKPTAGKPQIRMMKEAAAVVLDKDRDWQNAVATDAP
jgi:hypothetical protein